MARPRTNTKTKQITFSVGLLELAEKKAEKFGITFPEFVRHVIINNVADDLPVEYLDEKTSKEVGEALEEYKQGKGTKLKSKKEIREHFKQVLEK